MHGLSIEHRNPQNIARSRDLARHIMERSLYGKVVVVANNPNSALSAMRKQWVYLLNRLQIDRARTLKTERIYRLSHELVRLRSLTFSAKAKDAMQGCGIVFATADDLMYLAPPCITLYVTYDFPREQLHLMTSWMPANGLVVFYE